MANSGTGAKVFASLFFLAFFSLGLFFVTLTARESIQILQTWTWKKADCKIVAARVRETDGDGRRSGNFYFDVEYRYDFEGRTFASDQYTRKTESFSDYSKAARLMEQYQPGTRAVCYVNPSVPSEAILRRGSPWFALVVLFPMIFVVIGAGGIYLTWSKFVPKKSPISDRAVSKARGLAPVLFVFLLLLGGGLLYGFVLRPLFKIIDARGWERVPCTVVSSEVKSHTSDDGTTYSVNILYAYEYKEREFRSNTYGFMAVSSSGYSGKQAIVRRHPPGAKAFCYVNPRDPTEAVLDRGFSPIMLIGLLPLVLVLIGASGLIKTLRKSGRSAESPADPARWPIAVHLPMPDKASPSGPITLKAKLSPVGKLLVAILIVAFWNGLVSIFVLQVVESWRSGPFAWFLAIFLIPFVLVGVGGIVLVVYFFLGLFNPRPLLTVSPGAVPLGEQLEVWWEFSGRSHVLNRVRIWLEGREEATYRRGTQTYTDKNVFAHLDIADGAVVSGIGSVTVPADLMHSFAGDSNKIIWSLHVKGNIALWADVDEEFPITILPLEKR